MTEANIPATATDAFHARILKQIEILKALAEREMTPVIAMQGQLIAEVIGEAFEEIASVQQSEPEALTESELWQKFINSDVHLSTRLGPTDVKYKPRKLLDDGVMLQEEIELINQHLFSEIGSSVIGEYIDELEIYLANLKTVHFTFELEKDTYRTCDDEHDDVVRYEVPDYAG